MEYKHKAIGFAPDLVPLIQSGAKTLTYRLDNKYAFLEIEDEIGVRDSANNAVFGKLRIIQKEWTTFGKLPINREGHEVYPSKEAQRAVFKKYYGRDLNDEDRMLILEFQYMQVL